MSIIDTLRPTATISSLDWTSVPVSGAAWVVTADDSDATYVVGEFDAAQLVLSVGVHGAPVGHRRHLARVRARGRSGQVTVNVTAPGAVNAAFSSLEFTSSFTEVVGSWGGGLPPTVAGDFGVAITVESISVDISELYVDIDSRAQPTYDPQVSDGTTVTTTITTTSAPTVEVINVDTDDLSVSRWRAWVTPQGSSTIAWDSGSVAGSPVARQTTPLVNGSYTLHIQLWSLLGDGSEYAGAEDTLDFTVNLQPVTPPVALEVEQVPGTPLFEVTVTTPDSLADYDGDVFAEIQRTDCDGNWSTIALTGPVVVTSTENYVDWTAPRTPEGSNCAPGDVCEFQYRVRFVGTVNGQLATSEWVYETIAFGHVDYAFTSDLSPTLVAGGNALVVTGGAGNYAATPDDPSLDITGDLDIRALIAPDDWTPAANRRIVAKYVTAGSQQSFLFSLLTSGALSLTWTTNGFTLLTETSSVNLASQANGSPLWVRVTLDVNNGAGDAEVEFFTSTNGETWAQLGTTQLVGATTSIFAGTAPLEVGSRNNGADGNFTGEIVKVNVRSGIDGTTVADPDFSAQAAGTTVFTDDTGRTWTVHGTAVIASTVQGSAITATGLSPQRLSMGYSTDPELVIGSVPVTTPSSSVYLALTISALTLEFPDLQVRRLRFKAARSTLDDNFNRLAADTWAGGNFTWLLGGGVVPGNYDVDGTRGLQVNTTVNAIRHSYADAGAADADVYTVVNLSQGTLTGAGSTGFILARMTDTGNWYAARLGYATSGALTLQLARMVGGAGALVGSASHVVGTFPDYSATNVGVRFQVEGSTLRARAWDTAGAEPSTWQVTETDTNLPTGRFVGVAGRRDTGNTNVDLAFAFDTFRAAPLESEVRSLHIRTSADSFTADVYATSIPSNRTEWTQFDVPLNVPFQSTITLQLHPAVEVTGTGQHVSVDVDDIEVYLGDSVSHSLEWSTGDVLLRTEDADGPLWAAACGIASWDVDKPFSAQLGVMGGQQVSSGVPGGHDLTLNLGVTSQEDLEQLERILERQLVLVSPADSDEQWSAPSDVGVTLVKIRGVRTLVTRMIGTGPEPAHEPGEVLE